MTTQNIMGCRNEKEAIPTQRNLDGIYNRIKRGDRMRDVCFTDLTVDEQKLILQDYEINGLRNFVMALARALREVGDRFNIIGEDNVD